MAVYFPDKNALFVHIPKTGGCLFYSILRQTKIKRSDVGYQHSTPGMVGAEIYKRNPLIICFVREKEPWFKSYWKWRMRNKDAMQFSGGPDDLWHPKWQLEYYFDIDYDKFRANIEKGNPTFFEHMLQGYLNHPFDYMKFNFNDIHIGLKKAFGYLGYSKPIEYFEGYKKVNAS